METRQYFTKKQSETKTNKKPLKAKKKNKKNSKPHTKQNKHQKTPPKNKLAGVIGPLDESLGCSVLFLLLFHMMQRKTDVKKFSLLIIWPFKNLELSIIHFFLRANCIIITVSVFPIGQRSCQIPAVIYRPVLKQSRGWFLPHINLPHILTPVYIQCQCLHPFSSSSLRVTELKGGNNSSRVFWGKAIRVTLLLSRGGSSEND